MQPQPTDVVLGGTVLSEEQRLKLFVWDSVDTLSPYCQGLCFALAVSKEQAIDLICTKIEKYGDRLARDLREELTEGKPTVFDSPAGFYMWGSP